MITAKTYRNIHTGQIVTQVPLMSINDYVEVHKNYTVNSFKDVFRALLTMDLEYRETNILENLKSIEIDLEVPNDYKHFKITSIEGEYFTVTKRDGQWSITG